MGAEAGPELGDISESAGFGSYSPIWLLGEWEHQKAWWWDGRKEGRVPSLPRWPQDLSRCWQAAWMSAIILAVWQGCIRLERISRW